MLAASGTEACAPPKEAETMIVPITVAMAMDLR
jgi:hypothetical protein